MQRGINGGASACVARDMSQSDSENDLLHAAAAAAERDAGMLTAAAARKRARADAGGDGGLGCCVGTDGGNSQPTEVPLGTDGAVGTSAGGEVFSGRFFL